MRKVRRSTGPLDLRTQAILRAVIEEYVTTASPVGSGALVARYGLGVSSATVRNILAELESAGMLTHPHTSAGRIPTDVGYRYYVDQLLPKGALPAPVSTWRKSLLPVCVRACVRARAHLSECTRMRPRSLTRHCLLLAASLALPSGAARVRVWAPRGATDCTSCSRPCGSDTNLHAAEA